MNLEKALVRQKSQSLNQGQSEDEDGTEEQFGDKDTPKSEQSENHGQKQFDTQDMEDLKYESMEEDQDTEKFENGGSTDKTLLESLK